MTCRAAYVALAASLSLAAVATVAGAQGRPDSTPSRQPGADDPSVTVRIAGPGIVGRLLRDVIAAPHVTVVPPDTGIVFGRGSDFPRTLLVLGGPARLEGRVRGDFVVLGDLVLRPGAVVEGRAIAIGGQILNSSLAVVGGDRLVYRDVGFAVTPSAAGGYALDYRALERFPVPTLSLPGVFGVRIPTYDRIDGLTVRVGPEIALDTGRLRIEPSIAYRSHLGAIDPALAARWELGRRTTVAASAERGTFTNDRWMRGDLSNTAVSFLNGGDARNYYRADRAEASVTREWQTSRLALAPFVGARLERSWSAGRDSTTRSAPYSVLGRRDRVEGILRPNPLVTGGTIGSALVGALLRVPTGRVTSSAFVQVEIPAVTSGSQGFVQLTGDGTVAFPAFRDQRFEAHGHAVGTSGRGVPTQRYAYLGGSTTIPTLDLLSLGGDRLVWLESRYTIPVSAVHLPLVGGSPTVTLRHIVGGAGIGALPSLTQNVGVRLSIAVLRLDFVVDPADTGRHRFGVGVGLP